MTALCWEDLDCTAASRGIEHASVVHDHHESEVAACRAFIAYRGSCVAQLRSRGRIDVGMMYVCIRGPRGIIRGVMQHGRRIA